MLANLSLRIRVFLFFAALALGTLGAMALGLSLGYRRLAAPETLPAFVQGGVVTGFVTPGLVAWVWFLFDANVAKPIDILSGALRARAHSDGTSEMDVAIAKYLGDLAPAATAAAHRLAETQSDLALSVMRETQRLSDEKSPLETLLSDVPVGVLLCSGDHTLAFYNTQAVDLMAAGTAPGLDRKLFDRMDATLRQEVAALAHAVTELSIRHDESRQDGWPLAQTRASDLADGLKARLGGQNVPLTPHAANILLRANGFKIISLLDGIALHIRDSLTAQDLSLTIE